jgi:copper oxidase (laccase) domain-containing protein
MTTTASTFRRSSSNRSLAVATAAGAVHIRCSTRSDGDFHRTEVPLSELESRRRRFVDLPWTMLDEQHGTDVVRVDHPGAHDGDPGDVVITDIDDAVLGCWVADCAPIVLIGAGRTVAVAHAGWRGLAAGVIDRAIAAIGEPLAHAVLGPAIAPCCYEFGRADLELVARGVRAPSAAIAATAVTGSLALDVGAAVAAAITPHGIELTRIGGCTGCTFPAFSHRVRRDRERHVVAVWRSRRVTS